ncbi:MAG: PD-(D/E)XK nuclease family protein, partial [Aeriscardovia sp.]|nr:PD-(D/E)XK nuclease family protein [Aeriscardovia sp.]
EKPWKGDEEGEYVWPLQIKEGLRKVLTQSAARVLNAPGESQSDLSRLARKVLDFNSLSNAKKSLKEQFAEAEKNKSLSTTFLQWLEKNPRSAMQSVIRPMPHDSRQKAEAGTEFHAWVATHLLNPSDEWQCKIKSEYEEEIAEWKNVFLASEWNGRKAFCAEKSFTVLVPGLLAPVTAKMDAVFKGDLKGEDPDSKLTIVDWKTGSVPKTGDEKDEKLLQLEIYRLVLSRALQKDINDIDACLYYLSEGGCQIPALPMSEEDVIEKIASIEGISALSDEAQEEA